jgi:hypothetical protein
MSNIIGKWQIVPNGAGCFEIFDQDKGVFAQGKIFHREIDAEDWIQNHQEQIEGSVETMEEKRYTLMNDFLDWDIWDHVANRRVPGLNFREKAEAEAWADEKNAAWSAWSPDELLVPFKARLYKKYEKIVLDLLADKVVCSSCNTQFHGQKSLSKRDRRRPWLTERALTLKVTRYIGADSRNLTVDLTCTICLHTGLYYFDDNPLLEAIA